ncbi:MAG: putative toxin-antitoxin system toxin component, PIN family [Deferrisomatales bacterium]
MSKPILVLDTNVLVSALIRPAGPPGRILDSLVARAIELAFDDRILAEYRNVLRRPRFGFLARDVEVLLDHLERCGRLTFAAPLPLQLPDADDLPFMEVAVAAQADALVTGNLKHFPASALCGLHLRILSPAAWLCRASTPAD